MGAANMLRGKERRVPARRAIAIAVAAVVMAVTVISGAGFALADVIWT